jgi:hydrogenase maturation protease
MNRVRVIGCGNRDAGDDALGLIAVRSARERLPETVEVIEAGTPARVIDLLADVDAVVLVDAVRSAGAATDGGVIRLVAVGGGVFLGVRTSLSSHGLGLAEVLGLASAIGPLPRVVFLGLGADQVAMGSGLSAPVAAGLPKLVDAVVAEALALTEASIP